MCVSYRSAVFCRESSVMLPVTGWSHQDDGDVTGLLFGASAVAATGIKPRGTAAVMSPLLHSSE